MFDIKEEIKIVPEMIDSGTRSSREKHSLMRDLNFMSISKDTFNVSMLSIENLKREVSKE